ncbi:HEPN domain-containing protein [Agriterribacter sp.]|uniref:HEPN domain-containing protein n=1 Tax=Agriterribacter sp. TaxID=2821509 RepID=UPI002CE2A13D|nr:HEPN domain-containing protein [Agriterribacter sp.]HRP58379.1 HEPN domain-containing protein [Agriterribacter sp.]
MNEVLPYTPYSTAFATHRHAVVKSIVKAAAPESILLLGLKTQHIKAESIFNNAIGNTTSIADTWLLVLLGSFGNKSHREWQDKIEAHCSMIVPTTTIVMEAAVFKERVMREDRLAAHVLQQAECLYSIADMPYNEITNAEPAGSGETGSVLNTGINKAKEFLAGAELYLVRKQYNLSAFMLHQSAEQSLLALLSATTGFYVNTHNVERLLRYCSFLAGALTALFQLQREEDKRLIKLLQKAYIDTRYGKDYSIHHSDLLQLTEKIRCIADIVSSADKQMINTLTPTTMPHEKQYR